MPGTAPLLAGPVDLDVAASARPEPISGALQPTVQEPIAIAAIPELVQNAAREPTLRSGLWQDLGPELATSGATAPLPIAVLDTAEPITLAAPVRLAIVPIGVDDDEASSFAGHSPAPIEEIAKELLPTKRVAAARAPVGVPDMPVHVGGQAAAAAPAPDHRAYVPQISMSERQAYIAQLDREHPNQQLAVRIDGRIAGKLQFQVSEGGLAVNVGQVLDLFAARMEPSRFAALRNSQAAREFVPLETIRSSGIPLRYDAAYDEIVLGGSNS